MKTTFLIVHMLKMISVWSEILIDSSTKRNILANDEINCGGIPVKIKRELTIDNRKYYMTTPICLQSDKLICFPEIQQAKVSIRHCNGPLSIQRPILDCNKEPTHEFCEKSHMESSFDDHMCLWTKISFGSWNILRRINFFEDSIGEFFTFEQPYKYLLRSAEVMNNVRDKNCSVLKSLSREAESCSASHPKVCELHNYQEDSLGRCEDKNCLLGTNQDGEGICLCPKDHCTEEYHWTPGKNNKNLKGFEVGLSYTSNVGLIWNHNQSKVEITAWSDDFIYETRDFQNVILDDLGRWIYGKNDKKLCILSLLPEPKITFDYQDGIFNVKVDREGFLREIKVFGDITNNHQVEELNEDVHYKVLEEREKELKFELIKKRGGQFWAVYVKNKGFGFIKSDPVRIENDERFILQLIVKFDKTVEKDPLSCIFFQKIKIPNYELLWMKTLHFDLKMSEIHYLVHMYSEEPDFTFKESFAKSRIFFQNYDSPNVTTNIVELRNLQYCKEDTDLEENNMNRMEISEGSYSFQLCRDQNLQLVLKRKCVYDYHLGAHFVPEIKCSVTSLSDSQLTRQLEDLLKYLMENPNLDDDQFTYKISDLLKKDATKITHKDILIIADILKQLRKNIGLEKMVTILDHLMEGPSQEFIKAQEIHTTDRILLLFEEFQEEDKDAVRKISKNIKIRKDFTNGTIGYMLVKSELMPIHKGTSEEDIYKTKDFKAAIFLKGGSFSADVSFTFYASCAFFHEFEGDQSMNCGKSVASFHLLKNVVIERDNNIESSHLVYLAKTGDRTEDTKVCAEWIFDDQNRGHWEQWKTAIKIDGAVYKCTYGTTSINYRNYFSLLVPKLLQPCNERIVDCNGISVKLFEETVINGKSFFTTDPVCVQKNKQICLIECNDDRMQPIETYCKEPLTVQKELVDCSKHRFNEYCIKTYESVTFHQHRCYFEESYKTPNTWVGAQRYAIVNDTIGEFFYGMSSPEIISVHQSNVPGKNCAIFKSNNIFQAESCEKKHSRICSIFESYNLVDWCPSPTDDCRVSFNGAQKPFCICSRDEDVICNENSMWKPVFRIRIDLFYKRHFGVYYNEQLGLHWQFNNKTVEDTYWDKSFKYYTLEPQSPILNWKNEWAYAGDSKTRKLCAFNLIKSPHLILAKEDNKFVLTIPNSVKLLSYVEIFSDTNPKHQISHLSRQSTDRQTDRIEFIGDKAGHYWGQLINPSDLSIIRSNIILIPLDNRFIIKIDVTFVDFDENPLDSTFFARLKFPNLNVELNWMKTMNLNSEDRKIKYLIHVHHPDADDNYYETFYKTKKYFEEFDSIDISIESKLRALKFCETDITENLKGHKFLWPLTEYNQSSISSPLCLNERNHVVKRKCLYDFYNGAYFEDLENCVILNISDKEITNELINITQGINTNSSSKEILTNLKNITQRNKEEFNHIDIFLISEILSKINTNETDLQDFTSVFDDVMQMDRKELHQSQEMNSTDRILDTFEKVQRTSLKNNSQSDWFYENIIVSQFETLDQRGVALVECSDDLCILPIFSNMSQNIARIKKLNVAVFLKNLEEPTNISIAFYLTCSIFNENEMSKHKESCAANSISVLLPNEFKKTIKVGMYFKQTNGQRKTDCGFWYYGYNIFGKWDRSQNESTTIRDEIKFCEFNHTTNYAILFSAEKTLSHFTHKVLDTYTKLGAGLTCFSTVIIYLTAFLFENWRRNPSNKALMHYITLIQLQVILLYVSDAVFKLTFFCVLIGALLHYVILAEFMWSLIFAWVQYQRLVKSPLKVLNRWNKLIMICYLLPIIPVAIILAASHQCYMNSITKICYPSGIAFTLALLLPMALVVGINIVVLILIGWELFAHNNWGKDVHVRCATLLTNFMVLGITWSFAVYGEIFQSGEALYIFALLVNFQGFFILIKFIFLSKDVRRRYARLINQKLFEFGFKK